MAKVTRKRLEITTETYLKITFRGKFELNIYCRFCEVIVRGFSIDQLSKTMNISLKEIYEFDSEKLLHFVDDKEFIICGNSLSEYLFDPGKTK